MSGPATRVSIVLPVLAEAARIERCLRAVAAQDWPAADLEVVLVDGAPGDGTAALARRALAGSAIRLVVVDNPGGSRSANLNAGLAVATGAVLCRVDARSALSPHHVRRCVALLADPSRVVVGGGQRAVPPAPGPRGEGIARALRNRFAMGMAKYRRGGTSGPTDTVYLGAFRTHQVRAVGGWDEGLAINEDFDLNRRLGALGAVWFDDELTVAYLPRASVRAVAAQYRDFGRWKVRALRAARRRAQPRQLAGLAVLPAAVLGVAAVALLPPGLRLVAAGGVAVGGLLLEASGSGARGGLVSRLWSLCTCLAVVGSWALGAWAELVRPSRPGSPG